MCLITEIETLGASGDKIQILSALRTSLLILVFLTFLNRGFSQQIRINDTTFILVDEDTATQDKTMASSMGQPIDVLFLGQFEKDFVKIVHNNRCVFADTISTIDADVDQIRPNAKLKLTMQGQNNLRLIVNDFETAVPFRKGYRLLYISSYPDKIDNRHVYVYAFTYTNKYLAGM